MASKKQYVLMVVLALWGATSGALSGLSEGAVGVVTGVLGGLIGGALIAYVIVALYNSRTEDEVLTVEDVQ